MIARGVFVVVVGAAFGCACTLLVSTDDLADGTVPGVDAGSPDVIGEADVDAAPPNNGCSDGTREGFLDIPKYPDLAGCAGGWQIAGLLAVSACARVSGNSSSNPNGNGCAAADLCAPGWHLCRTASEVGARNGGTNCGDLAGQMTAFYATQQSGQGGTMCQPTGTNDLFGCGGLGQSGTMGCAPLNKSSGDRCGALGMPWQCPSGGDELNTVAKPGSDGGGVICCRDP